MKPEPSLLQVALTPSDHPAPSAFARIRFGRAPVVPNDFHVPLRSLDAAPRDEVWTCDGPCTIESAGSLRIARSPGLCLVEGRASDEGDLRRTSRMLYDAMLEAIQRRGFPHIVKAWNYIARINEGGDDRERYKQFCLGRGDVYDDRLAPGARAPSATAIGSPAGEPLTVMLLAARDPVRTLENPRQVSAFRYPRRYGPRSPNFSRAALLGHGEAQQLFLSGTASIVGHASRHPGDVTAQLSETLANVQALFGRVSTSVPGVRPPAFADLCRLRVYLRRADDADLVRRLLAERLDLAHAVVLLEGDICRRELEVEVDGIVERLEPAAATVATGTLGRD